MQLNNMDCTSRSNNVERDSDLGDDLSHDEHSDDDMRDCDSVDGDHVTRAGGRLSTSVTSNKSVGDMNYSGAVGSGVGRSPDHHLEMQMSHHHQFPPSHPLNALGNFMGIGGLHGIPNLQHNDVLEKLKMQVRDMKVGLMDQDYAAAHAAAFGANVLPTPINTAFTLPPTSMAASFGHGGSPNMSAQSSSNPLNGSQSSTNSLSATSSLTNGGSRGGSGGDSFSFASPTAPSTKDVNPASNSSTSSEASNSSQPNNGWSFEEQYKQVRQLYEINDDPKRKEFLDDLFSFMQKRGTPINRLPIMAKSVLDLYELYNLVIARGGLVDVINKKLWQEIIKGLHLPSSITSAAFTLRTQYMKYLYPYECEKKNLSSPAELQAAIDGNRREGRRSSYGQYEAMHNQMQIPQMSRQALPGGMQQMSPLALVTHAAAANNQQAQAAAAAAAAHHRLMAQQVPNLVTHEIEQRMMEYLKLIQVKKEQNAIMGVGGGGGVSGSGGGGPLAAPHQQPQRQRSQSPEITVTTREALNALEMSRVALWQMYHNNTSPPASVNTSPQGGGVNANGVEPQRSEALNLSDSPPNLSGIKREREREPSPSASERDDFHHQPPPAKRLSSAASMMPPGFPASFYLPHGMAAAAANFHHATQHDSDAEHDDDDDNEHNTTANSSHDDNERQQLNGHHHHLLHPDHHHHLHHHHAHIHPPSDDSAIENSPSTSASAGNGHASPVSTKKIHLSKTSGESNAEDAASRTAHTGPLESFSLLSGLQFHVAHNGTGANGEQQLVVNLELNGIKYSGVLVASTSSVAAATPAPAIAGTSMKGDDATAQIAVGTAATDATATVDKHNVEGDNSQMETDDAEHIDETVPHDDEEEEENDDDGDGDGDEDNEPMAVVALDTASANNNNKKTVTSTGIANGPTNVVLKDIATA